METHIYEKFREAMRMLSFRRYGMAAEILEELVQKHRDDQCVYWLAYVYRRVRNYDRALELLQSLPGFEADVEKIEAERLSYNLFQQAMELQGRGEYDKIRTLLREAREAASDDPDLAEWIDEELEFYESSIFNRSS